MSASRNKALILMSSNKVLPLASPEGHPGLSTGVFLNEFGQTLKEFDNDFDFTLATPDGETPQIDVNGLALAFHYPPNILPLTAKTTVELCVSSDFDAYRAKHPGLVARRAEELELAYKHLGNVTVSTPLPNTDKEAASIRDEVAAKFAAQPAKTWLSAQQLVEKHRDPADPFDLGEFKWAHLPGGHAPMVDFVDNPWLGELINTLHENGVLVSLICHAPVAMASAKYRVGEDGTVTTKDDHPFRGIKVTTVPKWGELTMAVAGFVKLPGEKTRPTYYVDDALKEAGYKVDLTANPGAINLISVPEVGILTGNGPQCVDEQTAFLRNHANTLENA